MWPKKMARPGDIWLLALLLWCFPLLGISLGILFPMSATSWRPSTKYSIAVPAFRQDWTPKSVSTPTKKAVSAP